MTSWKFFRNSVVLALVSVMLIQVSACGYILYPERRNQPLGGNIDPGVAILDGLGLLLFIIPGLVAFIVDFTTHTIYFPPGKKASFPGEGEVKMTVVHVPPDQFNQRGIELIVSKEVGKTVRLDGPEVKVYPIDDIGHLPQESMKYMR